MKKTQKQEQKRPPKRGNWKCPVCKSKPKNPITVTAGDKYLLAGKELAILPHESKQVCGTHVRELHVQSSPAPSA